MLNIPEVEFKLPFPSETIAAVYLRPAGDAWAHVVALSLCRGSSARGKLLGGGAARLGSFLRARHSTVRGVRRC